MTSLLRSRREAEEFDALLHGAPPGRPELTELATLVAALQERPAVLPRAEFTAGLRDRLMAEAGTVLSEESRALALPVRRRGARERRLVAAAAATVLVGGGAGMAVASQSALPGDTLYPIKRTIERAEAGLNTSEAGKGRDLLAQAGNRLAEVERLLAANPSAPAAPDTLRAFSEQAAEGSALLVEAYRSGGDVRAIESIREFTARSLPVLQELARDAGPEAQEALAAAGILLQGLDGQALSLCPGCAPELPPLTVQEFALASVEVQRALEAAARLGRSASATGDAPGAGVPGERDPNGTAGAGDSGGQDSGQQDSGGHDSGHQPPEPALPDPGKIVDETTKGVKKSLQKPLGEVGKAVDETVEPISELVDELLPGVGELLEDLTDPVTGGLLGGG